MKNIQEIKADFEQILTEVIKINGISIESATQVATVILQESGKDRRSEIYQSKFNGNNNSFQPATDRQKIAMENLEIKFNKNISKAEASKLIEEAVQKLNGNKK